MANQIMEAIAGRKSTPVTNSFTVRPLDMRAMKEPVKGDQAIHQAQ